MEKLLKCGTISDFVAFFLSSYFLLWHAQKRNYQRRNEKGKKKFSHIFEKQFMKLHFNCHLSTTKNMEEKVTARKVWHMIWTTLASFPFLFLYVMARQNICCSAREFVKGDMDIYLFWNRSTNHRIRNNPRHFHKGLDLNVTPTHTMFIKWAQWSGRLITLPTVLFSQL